jgi:RNA polymerase primary sigma factor
MIKNNSDILREALLTLSPREERVIRMRYGINGVGEHTLGEIGYIFNLSVERIRQIQARAERKLKHPSRSVDLRSILVDIAA